MYQWLDWWFLFRIRCDDQNLVVASNSSHYEYPMAPYLPKAPGGHRFPQDPLVEEKDRDHVIQFSCCLKHEIFGNP